uniref:Uncharacterized protein n=1 Tax=Knipowitschia caucasica TaxID=637954 RepID=A0AAV2K0Z2_KNICA
MDEITLLRFENQSLMAEIVEKDLRISTLRKESEDLKASKYRDFQYLATKYWYSSGSVSAVATAVQTPMTIEDVAAGERVDCGLQVNMGDADMLEQEQN